MGRISSSKKLRQHELINYVKKQPFSTDEELAVAFGVSIPTIRLDRVELKIPELRERIRAAAQHNHGKVKTIEHEDITGELLEIVPGDSGMSVLDTASNMAFKRTKVIQGRYIYSMAESLAIAVIDANAALVGIANIKYYVPCYAGSKLFAKAEVKKVKSNKYVVWVKVMGKQVEVFKGKFILVSLDKMPDKK